MNHLKQKQRFLCVLIVVAMLSVLEGCGQVPEEKTPFAPQEETNAEESRVDYSIDNDYTLNLDELGALFTPEDYQFIPTAKDIETLQSLELWYPEYAEKIQFFIDHIGAYHQTAVNNVIVAPEKISFVLAERFAAQTPTGDWRFSLESNTLPYYIQYDQRWAFHPYGNGVMGYTGCGPTCLAMVAAALTGNPDITPDKAADFAVDRGYYISGSGTDWRLFTDGASELGLCGTMIYPDVTAMKQAVWSGNYLVVSLRPGDFTRVGHFVVVHSVDDNGFWLYDPNSIEHSSQPWPYEQLAGQIAQVWSIGKTESE